MFTSLKRILKFAWQGISRNKGLSLQVVFIMTVAVFVLTSLFIFNELSTFLISRVQEKVDISVYFKKEVAEEEILEVREGLSKFSKEIESVNYISKSQAQEIFLERHKNDSLYLTALEEVGDNPFLAHLNIRAKDPVFYAQISSFLVEGPFKNLVEKISYYESEDVINKLFALSSKIKRTGIYFSIFLVFLVFLITFNTVKLTIFSFKEEIATMRLVGAANWFIRGPFLIQGFLYGIFSVLIVDILLFTTLSVSNPDLQNWLFNFNLLEYFKENLSVILLWQIVFAFFLGIISSFFAVRKYLKI